MSVNKLFHPRVGTDSQTLLKWIKHFGKQTLLSWYEKKYL